MQWSSWGATVLQSSDLIKVLLGIVESSRQVCCS